MNTQEITNMVDMLNAINSNEDAYFGFFQYGGGVDESCIKANNDGLIRFAVELLNASLASTSEEFINGQKEFFSLSSDWHSEDSEFYFSYVEILQQSKTEIEPVKEYTRTWKDKLGGILLGGILIFILISILVGAVTIIGWLF